MAEQASQALCRAGFLLLLMLVIEIWTRASPGARYWPGKWNPCDSRL